MALTKYTQADFDKLKRGEDGYINLPQGDWSDVDLGYAHKLRIAPCSTMGDRCHLGEECRLGDWCILGNGCELGDWCILGNGCELGNWCKLGNGCELGGGCKLGDGCVLGDRCKLGNGCGLGGGCKLGDGCVLGNWCVLGDRCMLGKQCRLGRCCTMEGGKVPNAACYIVTNIGRRNDDAYAYCNTATGEIYVRAGCWFGGIDEFVARVHEVHAGTQHETDYIAFAEFARARFGKYGK